MDDTEKFIELVDNVCRRPDMFTVNGTFGEVAAVFTGIQIAAPNSPIADDDQRTFNSFVTSRLLVPSKYWWGGAIQMVAADDEAAISKLRDLLVEFATLRKTKTLDEIRGSAARALAEYTETEPARVWRQFLAARWAASRALIEPLIMPHPNAAVLWRGDPAPPGVAAQLDVISDSYVVSVVSGSVDSGEVSLATEVGIIDAHLVDGQWRIDASLFIESDLASDA